MRSLMCNIELGSTDKKSPDAESCIFLTDPQQICYLREKFSHGIVNGVILPNYKNTAQRAMP